MDICITPACMQLKEWNQTYSKDTTITEMVLSTYLSLLFTGAFIRIEYKKSRRDILWLIVLLLMLSNFFFVSYTVARIFINTACIKNEKKSAAMLIANCLSFTLALQFFNTSYWLLYYKYWEVSWTVPLQMQGIQPSERLVTNINRGQKVGVAFITLGTISLSIVVLFFSFGSNWQHCYLFQLNSGGWAATVCFFNIGIQYIMGVFFIDAACRIRRALKA